MATKRAQAEEDIARVRALVSEGKTEAAEKLRDATDEFIGTCAPKDRTPLREALRQAYQPPASAVAIKSHHDVAGVDELIGTGVQRIKDAVELGLKAVDVASQVAENLLEARLLMRNKAGLPDIIGSSKYTKDIAHDMFVKAYEGVPADDIDRAAAHKSLAKAVRNRLSDVVVAYLRGLDEKPDEARERFSEALREFPKLSPTEAVYALYEARGFSLPRKGRTEVAREEARRRAALVEAAKRGELPAGEEYEDEPELGQDIAAIERLEKSFVRVATHARSLSDEERASLKARINELIANLAAQAASL